MATIHKPSVAELAQIAADAASDPDLVRVEQVDDVHPGARIGACVYVHCNSFTYSIVHMPHRHPYAVESMFIGTTKNGEETPFGHPVSFQGETLKDSIAQVHNYWKKAL